MHIPFAVLLTIATNTGFVKQHQHIFNLPLEANVGPYCDSSKKKRFLETKTITCGRQLSNGSGTIPRFENDLMYSIPKLDHSIMLSSVETTAFI